MRIIRVTNQYIKSGRSHDPSKHYMIKSYVYRLLAVFLDYNKDLAYIYYLTNHTMFAFRNDNIYHKYKVAIKLFYTIFNCFPINCKQNDI